MLLFNFYKKEGYKLIKFKCFEYLNVDKLFLVGGSKDKFYFIVYIRFWFILIFFWGFKCIFVYD